MHDSKSIIDVLECLESAQGRREKEQILRQNADNLLLKEIFVAALDPYITYGITKFGRLPRPRASLLGRERDSILGSFVEYIKTSLASRSVTGNDAKDAMKRAFYDMDEMLQKWCLRILVKNLRCGVQETTINKVWKNLIRTFSCALCKTVETVPTPDGSFVITERIHYPTFVEPKLDGLRMLAVKFGGSVTLYTRNGRVIDTVPRIAKAIESDPRDNVVFDGEIMASDWAESNSIIMSKKNRKNDKNIFYNVFDIISHKSWIDQNNTELRMNRHNALVEWSNNLPSDSPLRLVESTIVNNERELLDAYNKYVSEGYEGVVIKEPAMPYIFKRSKALLKLKPVTTYEGVIVGWYAGRTGTKHEDGFGGFNMILPNGVITNVGSGFVDEVRARIEANPETWLGKIIEVEGQPPLTPDGKVRFPTFVRERSIADVDKAVLAAYEAHQQQCNS